MRVPKLQIPNIPEEKKTPTISKLMEIIKQLCVVNQQHEELIQQVKDEIARLKGQNPKPKIRPSTFEKAPDNQKYKGTITAMSPNRFCWSSCGHGIWVSLRGN